MAVIQTNSVASAAQPIGVTATDADLNATSNIQQVTSVTAANGGAGDTIDVTIEVVDPDGTALTAPTHIIVWLSDLATGLGGSAHTHSTGPAFTTGAIVNELISADAWLVLTDATGTAVLQLVDTANEDVTVNAQTPGGTRVADTTVAGDWDP